MRRFEGLALACALGAPALGAPGPAAAAFRASPADPAPVIAAERAFAARAAEVGVSQSFLDYMAGDAIVFAPDPQPARKVYDDRRPSKPPKAGGTRLAWWPNWAGIARSGDLGFTTGPAEVNGRRSAYYFTVWKRQPDGKWRWVYDGGVDSDPRKAPGPAAPVLSLAPGDAQPMPAARAFSQVKAVETVLAEKAATDSVAAYESVLTDDARVQGSAAPPATTPRAVERELRARPARIAFSPLGGEASRWGDLAWTYGAARWPGGRGHYVRIWQRRAGAWRLVFDQLLEVPPPRNAQLNAQPPAYR